VTFRAGPRVNITVSGDWESAGGSIIVPLHVNCRASSANTAMLMKHKSNAASILAQNIDKAPTILIADAMQTGLTKRHIV
jgi:hypothetical protein